MADERQRSSLKSLYDEVLLAFEEALDWAEDLTSPEPGSHLSKTKTWLENATSSLISWGVDARVDGGSLSAVEGTLLEGEVRCTLGELQGQLEKIIKECSFRAGVSSLPENITPVVPELSPMPCADEMGADEDPIIVASSLIGVLQDTMTPIRMMYASTEQKGPYRDLKRQIDDIYNQHIGLKDQVGLQSRMDLGVALSDDNPTSGPAFVSDIASYQTRPSVYLKPTTTVSTSVDSFMATEHVSLGQDLFVASSKSANMDAQDDYDIKPDDIVIAVMGVTGVGKSTFVQYFTDEKVGIGTSLEAYTSAVGIYKCYISSVGRFYLIDTPGFDDTHKSDTEVLCEAAFWLAESYKRHIQLTGIIYLHRINDVRVGNAALKNLRILKRLCGNGSLASVVLATTFWDNGPNYYKYEQREHELRTSNTFWKEMIDNHSKIFRQDAQRASGKSIIEHLLQRCRELGRPTLDIQKEMVDEQKALVDTGAGQEVEIGLKQQRERHERELAQVRTEWLQAFRKTDAGWQEELLSMQAEIHARIKQDEVDQAKLRADNAKLRQQQEELLRAREKLIREQFEDKTALMQQKDATEAMKKELLMLKRKNQQLSRSCTVM